MSVTLTRVDLSFRFDLWWSRLPDSPTDGGRVERLVTRPRGSEPGAREEHDAITVTPEEGVLGDRWIDEPHSTPDNQVSLINVHVARSLARDADHAALIGDNLHVDLDLSEANLPVGTRLEVGGAVLEISPKPHRPCRHFVERMGATAAKKVARAARRGRRGRGVLCRVVSGGEIRAGDAIRVERRPPASG